jgi:hypothetical protein
MVVEVVEVFGGCLVDWAERDRVRGERKRARCIVPLRVVRGGWGIREFFVF